MSPWIPAVIDMLSGLTGGSVVDRPYKIGDIYSDGACVAMITASNGAYVWLGNHSVGDAYETPLLTRWPDMKYLASIGGTERLWLKHFETKK